MNIMLKGKRLQLLAGMLTYLTCATVFGLAYRYAINPDGVAELRLAGYIAEGHFMRAVTPDWSLLFIFSLSPFLAMGLDGLTTARITIAISGLLLLFFGWLFMQRFDLSRITGFIVLLILAILISYWTVLNIGADLLFAACILLYMYLVVKPDILDSKKVSFLCGVAGGFSYLAHHYAFPFFIIHFPTSVFLRKYFNKTPIYGVLKTLLMGFSGFVLICSIWVIPVSIKYGDFIISAKGGSTYASVGPKSEGGHPFFRGGLYKPKNNYALHVFEDITDVKFQTWSPFESKDYFFHQIKLVKMNIKYIFSHFIRSSPFFTYPLMMIILGILTLYLFIKNYVLEERFFYTWIVLTFLIYCSGFILILARSPRRFYVLMLIMVIFVFNLFQEFIELLKRNFLSREDKMWSKRWITTYLILIPILAFSLKPTANLIRSLENLVTLEYINPYEDIAEQIKQIDFPAPVAFIRSSQKGYTDLYLAYFLNKQLLGRPLSRDINGITDELKAAGGKSLIVFDNLHLVDKLVKDSRYSHLARIRLREDERYWNAPNVKNDQIKAWDKEASIFVLR